MEISHWLRDYRNYIHPYKEYSSGKVLNSAVLRLLLEATKQNITSMVDGVGKQKLKNSEVEMETGVLENRSDDSPQR